MSLDALTGQMNVIRKNLTPVKAAVLVILAGATLAGFIFIMAWAGKPDFQVLYSNLAPEDAGTILDKLKEQQIPYRIGTGGTSILAPQERIHEIRLSLASQGLPQGSGIGFEIFDNAKLGMTEFVQNVNYQRALQGELARTINRFTEVESSRVHLVIPKKSLFIDKEEPATASVILKVRSGKVLHGDQIRGIVHLVASGIPGLAPQNVTVVDSSGRILAGNSEKSGAGKLGSEHLELQEKYERNLEDRVKTMLASALGSNKAIVRLSCSLDFTRQEHTEEKFYPENRVIRSEQVSSSVSNGEKAGGKTPVSAGREGEAPGPSGGTQPLNQKEDRTLNYEIGKVTSHIVEPVGKVRRVSVAVMVDGTYKTVEDKDGKTETKYTPRTPEEMEKLKNLVKRAVDFDAQRGDAVELVNIPFENPGGLAEGEEAPVESTWMSYARQYVPSMVKYGLSAVFLLMTFMFVVRPLVTWLTASPMAGMEMLKQLPMTVGEMEKELGGGLKGLPSRDRETTLVSADDDLSLNLMREWLKEK
jgi:flagellar M-ring protein FliF